MSVFARAGAKRLAQEYRALTGKPLGITGEIAVFETARILGVELTPARQAGYDAIRAREPGRRASDQGDVVSMVRSVASASGPSGSFTSGTPR